ncbi:FAD-binding oxidoreductase [Nonomuraea africana]|uniref:FAD/FMN-containing dehydrogenase n=1 Tax=Nonomuraea africana TaxID=46171 RepID=A0ABR9KUI5_9ACTN|nr:FAD-binding oxidoreductase [Nonomuraea africana]MBE1565697.1 FAD/FMN-containing dehydrogenase [Nonomuraea africana]
MKQPVRAVAEAHSVDDVVDVVRLAGKEGLAVTAQPSGHGASGDVADTILLRTHGLTTLEIDPVAKVARVGAGVRWGRLQAAAAAHGLTGLPGSSPVVTVTGYTLGGGLSWFSRKHGFASSSVRSFDIVDAEGNRSVVTRDDELFWALRGGGGDFALVTAMELDLHPLPDLYGGRVLWPATRAPEVLEAFKEITATAPDELTVWFDLLRFPGSPPFVAVDSTYLGKDASGFLAPLDRIGGALSDTRAPMPLTALGDITGEPTDPGPGASKAQLLDGLDGILERVMPIDPLISVQIRHLGGALARPSDSAAGQVAEPYLLYMFGLPGAEDRQREIADGGRKPFTFLAPGESAAAAFPAATLERLRDIKRRHDPANVFRSNYPVLAG